MASFSDTVKTKVQSMSVAQQKQAIKSAGDTFKKGTPEYAQYKAEIAHYEVDAQSFFNTQRDTIAREAVFKKSELDSQKEYSATIGDRAKAFIDTAYLSSDVAKAINRFAIENVYSDGTEDKDFMSTNNVGEITKALATNGIAQSEYAYELLQNAKNPRDFDFYIQTLRTDEKMKESSAYLTPFRAGLASVEGAVLTDPTMLAYAPARLAIAGKEIYSFQQLQNGRRLAAVVGTNAALQGSLSLMREYGSPERTATDLALDIAFGGVIDGYFTMKQLGRLDKLPTGNIADDAVDVNDFARMHEDARTINRGLTQFGNKAYDLSRSDLTGYKWSAGVEATVKAEMDAVAPTTTELTGLNAIRAEVETFTPVKETTETLLRTAGKTDEEITLAVQTAKQQEATLIAQVKATAKMDEATKSQEIAKVREQLKEIGKQSPEVEAKVMKEISKAIEKAPAPTKGKTATKVETAKQSYDKRSKQIAKVVENKKAKETKAKKPKQAKAKKTQQPKEEFSAEVKALETEQGVFHRIASVVDEIVDEAKTTIDDIITDGLPTKADKDAFAQELSDDLTDILGQEVKVEINTAKDLMPKTKLEDELLQEELSSIASKNSIGTPIKVKAKWWKKSKSYDTEDIVTDENKLARQSMQEGDFGRNYIRNLEGEVNFLYRETSTDGIYDILYTRGLAGSGELFFASSKQLALGQGKNQGIMIKIKPNVRGKTNLNKSLFYTRESGKEYIVKDTFENISKQIDEIVVAKDVFDSMPLKQQKRILALIPDLKFVETMDEYRGLSTKQEGVIVKGKLKFSVNGDTANINGNLIKVGTLMALGGSSVAMADSGDSVEFFNPFFVVIALAAGVYSTRAIRNAGGLKHVLKSTWEKVDSTDKIGRIMEKPMFKSWEAFRQTSVDKANFEIVNSMQVIMNNGSEMSKKIGQRLGFDAVNPQQVLNAMQGKMIMVREWVKTFTKTEDINYRAWLKENNLNESLWDEVLEGGAETKYREMFLQQCTDYVEFGKYADSPAVVAQANIGRGIFDDARKTGILNKIIGFSEKLTPSNPNYIPRMALNEAIMSIVANGGKEALSAQFVKAMRKSLEAEGKTVDELGRTLNKKGEVVNKQTLQELADNMIDWYSDVGGKYGNKAKADAVIKAMKRLGYDTEGIDADLLIAESKTNSDAISRGKFRIPMDFSEFAPFEVTIDGVEQTVTLGTIFERNMNSLVKAYSDQVGGAVALRRSTQGLIEGMDEGVTSESALRELIDKEPNPDVREVLHTYVSVVAGKPLYESTRTASRLVDGLRDYAYSRLALTQFAMVSEYATALTNMMMSKPAMEQGLTHLRNIVRRATGGESVNTAMAETVQRLTGYGSSALRRENTLKNIDNVFNMASNSEGNTIEKVGLMVKYLTLRLTNILHADDAMKTISAVAKTDYLNKWLRGEITISKNRLERFGVDDKFVEMFKGGFKSDTEGNLLADYDKGWTQKMKDEYARVVNKMIMVESPEAIASTLPHVALTSDAGRLTSFMTHFTATSYTTKFLQGAKRPDLKSYADTMIYFMGTYAGVYARHLATEQEEPDPKEVLYKSIMMMPMTAPYGIYSMVTDPMTTSMPNDIITEMSKLQDIVE